MTARRALVTGGGAGIGAAIAYALAADGAAVTVADIDGEAAASVAREVGGQPLAIDVSDPSAVAETVKSLPPFAILVNNAGIDQHAFFTATTPAEWQRLIAVNLVSVLACTHAVLPGMQAAGWGRIVTVASEAGRRGSKGGAVYAAAKGGAIAFAKSIAIENARYGITSNIVCPGPIATALLAAAVATGGERLLTAMTGATLAGRLGQPEEVASAVAYLASEAAAFVTGEVLGVSGGMGL